MNLSFNRLILFAKDVNALKNFYLQNFQFVISEEIPDEWVVLQTQGGELALHKAGVDLTIPVNNNIKLVFETTSDLHAIREELVRNNIPMKEVKSFGGPYLYCDGRDPEGNAFQLMQKVSK